MQDTLKIMKSRRMSSKTFWSNPSLIGQGLLVFLLFLTSLNLWSLFFFLPLVEPYTSYVIGLHPYALFNEMNYLLKKKKLEFSLYLD
jgi:hypothetical protein